MMRLRTYDHRNTSAALTHDPEPSDGLADCLNAHALSLKQHVVQSSGGGGGRGARVARTSTSLSVAWSLCDVCTDVWVQNNKYPSGGPGPPVTGLDGAFFGKSSNPSVRNVA